MGRSFITGGLAGLLTSVAALALLSLAVPTPETAGQVGATATVPEEATTPATEPDLAESGAETAEGVSAADPVVTMVEVPEGSEFAKTGEVAGAPDAEAAPTEIAPQNGAPVPEAVPALTETQPAAEPDTEATEAPTEMAPEALAEAVVEPVTEEPVSGATGTPGLVAAEAPDVPARASGAGQAGGPPTPGQSLPESTTVETDVASVSEADSGAAPATNAAPVATAVTEPDVSQEAATTTETEPAVDPALPEQEAVAEGAAADIVAPLVPTPDAAEEAPTEASAAPSEVAAEPGDTGQAAIEAEEPQGGEADDAEAGEPRIITMTPEAPAPGGETAGLESNTPGVKILRLPGTSEATEPADVTAPEAAPTSPLASFAAPWSNPEGKPVLGVVILDVGSAQGGAGSDVLSTLSFPVTVAVDPLRADAGATAAAYRAAGAEVALLVDSLPTGATPADLEVAYQSYIKTLPEAVALVGNPQASFLRSSTEAQHVSALLAADGRGLVTYQAGLNLARRAAEKAGAPVVTIEKYFGPAGADTMARELDRAAFSAAQSGSAVIALPSTPEMLSALAAWASGPSGAAVSLAPVSALMLSEPDAVATPPEEATAPEPVGDESSLPGQKVGTFSDSN